MFTTAIKELSRREFLKLSSLGMLKTLLPSTAFKFEGHQPTYGRVMDPVILSYTAPSFESPPAETHHLDDILTIKEVVIGEGQPYNQAWFAVNEGYIHSALLQPVGITFNQPEEGLNSWGELTEVTVPFTDAREKASPFSKIVYRYYYASTHWVDRMEYDSQGTAWYRVLDDGEGDKTFYVQAKHLRAIPQEELASVSPSASPKDKRIEIRLAEHMLIAYEENHPVFIAQCSSGDHFTNQNWRTPTGGFETFYKRASRHMAAGNLAFGDYDLPGVPWVSYLTNYGIAIHGTYWHNDFGRPRSHGCINLTPEAAKWVYRWTTPEVPPGAQLKYKLGSGTRVDILPR